MKKSVIALLFLAAGVGFATAQTTKKEAPTKQEAATVKTVVDAPVQVSSQAVVDAALTPQTELENGLKADLPVQKPKVKNEIKEVKSKESSTVKAAVNAEVRQETAEKQVPKKVTTQ